MKKRRKSIALIIALVLIVTNVRFSDVRATSISDVTELNELGDTGSDPATEESSNDSVSEESTEETSEESNEEVSSEESSSNEGFSEVSEETTEPSEVVNPEEGASDEASAGVTEEAAEDNGEEKKTEETDETQPTDEATEESTDQAPEEIEEIEQESADEELLLNTLNTETPQAKPTISLSIEGSAGYDKNGDVEIHDGSKWYVVVNSKDNIPINSSTVVITAKNETSKETYTLSGDSLSIRGNKIEIKDKLKKGAYDLAVVISWQNSEDKTDTASSTVKIGYYVDENQPVMKSNEFVGNFLKIVGYDYFTNETAWFKAVVEDEANGEYEFASGVKEVYAYVAEYKYDALLGELKESEYPVKMVGEDGVYYAEFGSDAQYFIKSVYAYDYAHGDSPKEEKGVNKTLIKKATAFDVADYNLTGGNNWIRSSMVPGPQPEWYSKEVNGTDLTLEFYFTMYGEYKPEAILTYRDKGSDKDVVVDGRYELQHGTANSYENGVKAIYTIDAKNNFERTYTFTYKIYGDWYSKETVVPVNVDNNAPTGTFDVSFTAKTEGYYIEFPDKQDNQTSFKYTIGTVDGKVFTSDKTFSVTVSSENSQDDLSGVKRMEFYYSVDGNEQEKPCEGNATTGDNPSVAATLETYTPEGVEQTYKITRVLLYDKADNCSSLLIDPNTKLLTEDKVTYEIDTKAPTIESIAYPQELFRDAETGALYYDSKFSVNALVKDRNLLTNGLYAESVDGGLTPSISRTDKKNKENKNELNDENHFALKFANGSYTYKLIAKDQVGHTTEGETKRIVIDTENPEISINCTGGINADSHGEQYSNSPVTVNISIREPNLLREGTEVKVTGVGADHSSLDTVISGSQFEQTGSDMFTYSFPAEVDGKYKVSVKATDKCNHSASAETGEFYVDQNKPIVEVSFDDATPLNGYYYNQQRTAHIKVKDFTFDESKVDLNVEASDVQPELSGWSGSDLEYSSQLVFSHDGKYRFRFSCTDKAGNKSDVYESDEFYIDRTSPKITVNFDNNAAENQFYYKNKRTATINIEELSFDDSTVKITPLTDGVIDALPQVSGFSGGDKNHSATISFSEDGRYGFSVECTDLAGNTTDPVSTEVFVIDTTVPEVTITGVEDRSANNGVVAPVVTYIDKNVDTNKSAVKTVGKNNGDITASISLSPVTDGYVASLADFPHEKKYDDLYVVTANVFDLAGNQTEKEIMFSVNRFGSVYVIDDKTAALIADYYTNVAPEVSITEINIDELQWKNVNVGRDGEMTELKSGKDYTVSESEDSNSWNSFTYTVKAKNFSKDGKYSVVISSKDAATNEQDNVVKEKEVEFAVDMTAPGIAVSGLENEGVYEEESHLVSFNITDNMGVVSAAIYDDGELLEEYTEDKLEKDGFTEQVDLKSADKKRAIKIVSTDVAGNESVTEYDDVIISLNAKEVETKGDDLPEVQGDVSGEGTGDDPVIPRNKGVPVLPIAGGSTAAVVGGYALVEFLKKKKIIGK